MKRAVVVAAVLVAGTVRPAAADEEREADDGGYWTLSAVGGVLVPIGDMKATHQAGLLAGGRVGWTSRIGLGVEVGGLYSPLPRTPSDEKEMRNHYAVATVGPRYTYGHGRWRGTAVLDGGVAVERTRFDAGGASDVDRHLAPVVGGSARLEVYLSSNSGLVASLDFTQELGGDPRHHLDLLGGLVLSY